MLVDYIDLLLDIEQVALELSPPSLDVFFVFYVMLKCVDFLSILLEVFGALILKDIDNSFLFCVYCISMILLSE